MGHIKLWETLKDMGIPDHLTRLLRHLYVGQEAIVKTLYGTTDWVCLLSLCLTYMLSTVSYDPHGQRL